MSNHSDCERGDLEEIEQDDSANEGDTEVTDTEQHNDDAKSDHDSITPEHGKSSANDNHGIINTVLAYLHYGISSATPDNVIEVACTHFAPEEIIEAKDKLWKECDLGDPPTRHKSKGGTASDAHIRDILDVIFKIDKDEYVFLVESGGIARLPRFNAECLNVIAIDQRIADLNEQCFALKLEASSYRNDYLRCQDDLNTIKTVLQQHTDALRHLRNDDGTFGCKLQSTRVQVESTQSKPMNNVIRSSTGSSSPHIIADKHINKQDTSK